MLQLLAEMELLTGCRKSDFLQNWNESKSQLELNVKRLLGGNNKTMEDEIPGKCYLRKSMYHY